MVVGTDMQTDANLFLDDPVKIIGSTIRARSRAGGMLSPRCPLHAVCSPSCAGRNMQLPSVLGFIRIFCMPITILHPLQFLSNLFEDFIGDRLILLEELAGGVIASAELLTLVLIGVTAFFNHPHLLPQGHNLTFS